MTLRTPPAASKVHQNNKTTKAKKDDPNIMWERPPLRVPQQHPTNRTIILPGLRKKAEMRKMLF